MSRIILALASCLWLCVAQAQTTVTETTTSSGTITEFTPGEAVVIRSETGTEPLRYTLSRGTLVVDESGRPVDVATVHQGVPVVVHYSQEGNRMVVSRIVVRKAPLEEKHTTTTTTVEER